MIPSPGKCSATVAVALLTLGAVCVLGCGDDDATPTDAGSPGMDSATPDEDSGTTPDPDSGTVPDPDGATPPPVDAGPPPVRDGIWISPEEVMALPMSGLAWDQLLDSANMDPGTPDLSDQDQDNNVLILAKALVHVRTGDEAYRTDVRQACMDAMGTEVGGRTLALGRELAAYVIAADLVVLEPDEDMRFRAFLRMVLTADLSGRTLQSTHEDRPNNWGTHAGASRAAVAAYLDDTAELDRTAEVFHGWLGDRTAYAGFSYGELSWQSSASEPRGINPVGATLGGENVDGVIPDDMRRGCPITWPPCYTNYPWGALEGATVMAEILHRRGYPAWEWEDRALLRAVEFLFRLEERYPGSDWWAAGDDEWQVWLVNHAYGETYPVENPAREGKNMGWTDWTHDPATRPRP